VRCPSLSQRLLFSSLIPMVLKVWFCRRYSGLLFNHFVGINCRFGMRGVIAEAHYDGRRNFVAMIRGRKR
jgi:hypothetical protein